MISLAKYLAKTGLAFGFPPVLSRIGGANPIPVLCYHSVNATANGECDPIHPELFEVHLRYLKAHHTVVPLRAVAQHLATGDVLSPDAVAITFDDGYRDNYEVAFPLLEKFDLPATFFVVTGFINGEIDLIGDPGWEAMNWKQVQEMDSSHFIEFGAHTCTHPILSDLTETEAVHEISRSRQELQTRLGREIDLFAYPNGQGADIPPIALSTVEKLGFLCACSTFWRTTHAPSQRFLINRVMISGKDSVNTLKLKLSGKFDYLYYVHKSKAIYNHYIKKRGVWK